MTHAQAIADRKTRQRVRRKRHPIDWTGVDITRPTRDLMAELHCSADAIYVKRRREGVKIGPGQPSKPVIATSHTARLTPAEIEQLRNLYPGKSLGWIIRNTALLPFADDEKSQFIERVTE